MFIICAPAAREALAGPADGATASAEIESAVSALARGRLPQALFTLRNVIANHPRSSDGYFYLGVVYAELNRHEKALRHVRRALELEPGRFAYVIRAQVIETQGRRQHFVIALKRFVQALAGRFGGDRYAVWRELAFLRNALLRWDEAIRAAERLLASRRDDAGAHLALGEVYLERNRVKAAVREFDRAGQLAPDRAEVHVLRGLAYASAGDQHEAAASFRQALSLAPDSATPSYGLGQALLALGQADEARTALRAYSELQRRDRQADDARSTQRPPFGIPFKSIRQPTLMLKRLRGDTQFVPVIYAEGFRLLERGKYRAGLAALKEAAAGDPLSADTSVSADDPAHALRNIQETLASGQADAKLYNDLGEIYFTLDRIEQAHDAFSRALELDEGFPGAIMNLGRLALAKGEPQVAVGLFGRTVEAHPGDSEASRMLALALWEAAQHDESIEQYERAIGMNPGDERLRLFLAESLLSVGRAVRAEEVLNQTVAAIARSGRAHYELARIHHMKNEAPESIDSLRTASALNPVIGVVQLVSRLGGLYAQRDMAEAAIAAFRSGIALAPNTAGTHRKLSTHQQLGNLYLRQNLLDEALAEFSAAAAIEPQNANAYAKMGQIFMRMKRYEDAAVVSRRALELEPWSRARYTLSRALLSLGGLEEGKAELEKFRVVQTKREAYWHRRRALSALKSEAVAYLRQGEREKAIPLLRKIPQYAPEGKNALAIGMFQLELARLQMGAEDYQEAINSLREAKRLGLDIPEIHGHLAQAYARLGRWEESEREKAHYRGAKKASPAASGAEQ